MPVAFGFSKDNTALQQKFNEFLKSIKSSGLYEEMANGNLKPYVTTIGLYNDSNELMAVAKLSTPIQRIFNTQQIFIVRFDT
jgi:hypothetical protein